MDIFLSLFMSFFRPRNPIFELKYTYKLNYNIGQYKYYKLDSNMKKKKKKSIYKMRH
jgi:hypothetical protein